jgi:nickel-dependent lactate racemase
MGQRYIQYGKEKIPLHIPAANLAFEIGPKDVHIEPQEHEEVTRALANPIGSRPLAQLVTSDQKVAIIVDDHTRLTPTRLILPYVLDELNRGGVTDSNIEIIIASGTHRLMTPSEKEEKYGRAVMTRVKVRDHECLSNDKLLDFGTTERGTHILVNSDVMQADFRLAIGVIFPHFPAGWGGGAKMLLPGIAGQDTVAQFHMLGSVHSDTKLGQVETITRREMEEFAARVGLHFIFNVVLDRGGRILKAFAGDFVKAHRAGVEFARSVYEVQVNEPADLVISSTSPIDHDYFQVMKGLYSAEVCTKPGGEIMLVSPVYEGMAATHREALQVTPLSLEEAMARIRRGDFEDSVGAVIATYQIKLRNRFDISVVSEYLSTEEARLLGVRLYSAPNKLQSVIDGRLQEGSKVKIGLLHQSTEVLPRVLNAESAHDG